MSDFTFNGIDLDSYKVLNLLGNINPKEFLKLKLSGFFGDNLDNVDFYILCNHGKTSGVLGVNGITLLTYDGSIQIRVVEQGGLYYLRVDCSNPNLVISSKSQNLYKELGNNFLLSNPFDYLSVCTYSGVTESSTVRTCKVDDTNSFLIRMNSESMHLAEHAKIRKDLGLSFENSIFCSVGDFSISVRYRLIGNISQKSNDLHLFYSDLLVSGIYFDNFSDFDFKLIAKEG